MTELLQLTIILLLSSPGFVALFTAVSYLLPRRAAAANGRLLAAPWRTFFVGLVNLLFFGLLAAFLLNAGEAAALLGVLLIGFLLLVTLIGWAGLLGLLQARLYLTKSNLSEPAQRVRTAVLLVGAMLTPFVGWFVVLPILFCLGLGAGIATLRLPREKTAES